MCPYFPSRKRQPHTYQVSAASSAICNADEIQTPSEPTLREQGRRCMLLVDVWSCALTLRSSDASVRSLWNGVALPPPQTRILSTCYMIFVCYTFRFLVIASMSVFTGRDAIEMKTPGAVRTLHTANLRTKILDFRGFDSSMILILRGGIHRPIGNSPESLSQAILAGIILLGRLGVDTSRPHPYPENGEQDQQGVGHGRPQVEQPFLFIIVFCC